MPVRLSAEEKKKRAIDAHADKYDYSQTNFDVGMLEKIDIICKVHGKFSQRVASHLAGRVCRKCGSGQASAEDNKKKAIDAHSDRYDYSNTDFDVGSTHGKIEVICRVHGVFAQQLSHHLAGSGCSACTSTGYDGAKPGVFYALHVIEADVVKVGITNRSVKEAYRGEKSDYEVIFEILFEDGQRPRDLENNAIAYFKPHRYEGSPALTTRRNTEVFCISKDEVIEYARQCGVL